MEENVWKQIYTEIHMGVCIERRKLAQKISTGNYTGADEHLIKDKIDMLVKFEDLMVSKAYEINEH